MPLVLYIPFIYLLVLLKYISCYIYISIIRTNNRHPLHLTVCELVEGGVQAIFGPSDTILGWHIHSICDALDIPHLNTQPDLDLLLGGNGYRMDIQPGEEEEEEEDQNQDQKQQKRMRDKGPDYTRDVRVNAQSVPTGHFIPPSSSGSESGAAGTPIDNDEIASSDERHHHHQPQKLSRGFAINLYPAQHLINDALLDVVQYLNWTRFAVLFEGNEGKYLK